MQNFLLNKNTHIVAPEEITKPIQYALDMFCRDMEKVFGQQPAINPSQENGNAIHISIDKHVQAGRPESFSFQFSQEGELMVMAITGRDELGLIYGLLHVSRVYLGIDPFWYWADINIVKKESASIPALTYNSPKAKVRFRGWFVNDEVCLIGWKEDYPPSKEVWQPVFEALLRLGGNMVIPGTDLPRHGQHFKQAADMGLWVTHHHAEPLGAEMFLRAYPGKQASYTENKALYEKLWADAIQSQKDKHVIWVLSFRGQGDQPFWSHDPTYDTDQARGQLISKVIDKQYRMLQENIDDPVTSIALYGEISELYRGGYIDVPEDVIKIWADNGYGKMVSRRNGNENKRIPSLPDPADGDKQGIYYHVTFHDLQASNHLTMLPSPPSLIKDEIKASLAAGGAEYLLLNSGNIRMHVYTLDIVSKLWQDGDIDIDQHLKKFINRLYTSKQEEITEVYKAYFKCAIHYGVHDDDLAGDEYYHHPARQIMSHWMQGNMSTRNEKLLWATPSATTFYEQVVAFKEKCETGSANWSDLRNKCLKLLDHLSSDDQVRFYDQFMIQVELHDSGCKGFISLCQAYLAAEVKDYPRAFVYASHAIWHYERGLHAMKQSEHGKWKNFYRADWLTNIEWTIESLITVRKYIRMQGDSPDFFQWYKAFIMPETEKHIYLENTHREPKSDDELARLLQEALFS